MTRQEEWAIHEATITQWFAEAVSRITGRHKRNTRDRGEYKGYTKSAVLKLIQRSQNAQKKKRHFTCSPSEEKALLAYYDERWANLGQSVSRGTPDWLKFDNAPLTTSRVEPFVPCGSIECRPDKW